MAKIHYLPAGTTTLKSILIARARAKARKTKVLLYTSLSLNGVLTIVFILSKLGAL
jgi:hypothetical protein